MNISREELSKQFNKLPITLQEAIFSAEVTEALLAIGKKYGIALDKIDELLTETHKVMLGLTHPNDFISSIQKVLGLERDVARAIAQEINTQIFVKIREELRTLHNIKDEEKKTEPEKTPTPPTLPQPRAPIAQKLTPPAPTTQQESFPHRDMSPLPPATRKPYTFAELQKQQSENKPTEAKPTPTKEVSVKPPALIQMPKPPAEEPQKTENPPTPQHPQPTPPIQQKQPSPFEAKIKEGVFRQQPSESTKEEQVAPTNTQPTAKNDHDPYREPIAPDETSLNINTHITKDEQ